ncbi:hypothetical protein F4777DRAFT_89224 [Nemania sp. FL0916]|nr:hypothetical protein F4777DRAFT_89224 [Nemania sp. FL0916]
METISQHHHRLVAHQCNLPLSECRCDPMPRYADAACVAAMIGIYLKKADWRGYKPSRLPELRLYKACLAAGSARALLKGLDERPVSREQNNRVWADLWSRKTTNWRTERVLSLPSASDDLNTWVHFQTSRLGIFCDKDTDEQVNIKTSVFINDAVSATDSASSEEWTLARHITVGLVYTLTNIEVIVAIGDRVLAAVLYDQAHQTILQSIGQIGIALEIVSMLRHILIHSELSKDIPKPYGFREKFEEAWDSLTLTIGAAAFLGFEGTLYKHGSARVKPQCCMRWMPEMFSQRLLALLPHREGFVDLRDGDMQSAVRPVLTQHLPLLCPQCWKTGRPSAFSRAEFIKPLRLLKCLNKHGDYTFIDARNSPSMSDECEQYTAVSHLWNEFRGDDTIRFIQNGTATIGGPSNLWIDRLCINQEDTREKAAEMANMGDYYAAAHTTLIVPECAVTLVPSVQPSRHLVAIPAQLRKYRGLSTWRQDRWHERVWTFQEGYMSKNPRVVKSDTNTGLNACWLDFIAMAAEQDQPTICEVGLPPWHMSTGDRYGGYNEYMTPFVRGWAACSRHAWAPDPAHIQMPLGALLDLTCQRRCTEEQDSVIGVLGLALSVKDFRADGICSLDDAYREAVRCGAIGAEILLADLGGTSPNSCWIPKKPHEARSDPLMRILCNTLQPTVDRGRLVCKAFRIVVYSQYRVKATTIRGVHRLGIRPASEAGPPVEIECYGVVSPRGKVYILEGAEDDLLSRDRILLCVSTTGNGSHHIESTAILRVKHIYGRMVDLLQGKDCEHVTLYLGSSTIPAPSGSTELSK